jgi:hypothetical protein
MRAKLGAAEGALELAENVLVKLAYARATDAIDWRTFGATLRCPFFRLNVHRAEVEQLLRLHHLFARSEEQHYLSEMLELAREWLALTLGSLAVPSFDPGSDPDEFERCEDAPPDVEDDWVVLQEFALTNPSLFDAVRLLVHGTTS